MGFNIAYGYKPLQDITEEEKIQVALHGLKIHNVFAKASSLGFNLNLNDFSHIDIDYAYTIKSEYNRVSALRAENKAKGIR